MSVSYRVGVGGIGTVDLGDVMYLGDIPGFTSRADGSVGMSGCTLQDPGGVLDFYGLNKWEVEESDAANVRIFSGIVTDRVIKRGTFDRTDVHAIWEVDVADQNEYLHLRVIRDGNHGNRPAETDAERVAWLLDEVLNNGHVINGTGGFFGANGPTAGVLGTPRNLDAADFRGQHALDVLNDMGPPGNRRFFTYYDPDLDDICLFYGLNTEHLGDSDIRISNVMADEDADTFYPWLDAELALDPSAVWGGILYTYKSGQKRLYREDPATIATFLDRSGAISNDRVGSDATASTFVDTLLEKMGAERVSITCTIRLPKERVNDLIEGMRVEVRFTHLPGFESFTFLHVIARTVKQDFPNKDFYQVTLELSDYVGGIGTGGGGGGGPFVPGEADPDVTYSICNTVSDLISPDRHAQGPTDSFDVEGDWYFEISNPQHDDAAFTEFIKINYNDPAAQVIDLTTLIGGTGGPSGTSNLQGGGAICPWTALPTLTGTFNIPTSGALGFTFEAKSQGYSAPCSAPYIDECWTLKLWHNATSAPSGVTPAQGQRVTEATDGDGATDDFQTNYPYLPNSLVVTVGGSRIVPDQTDPDTGTFSLPFAPGTGAQVVIEYQAASGIPTGATNDDTPPSVTPGTAAPIALDDLTDVIITSAADDDFLRFDGSDWVNEPVDFTAVGHYEVVMAPGITSPPEPVETVGGDDWVYGWVPS